MSDAYEYTAKLVESQSKVFSAALAVAALIDDYKPQGSESRRALVDLSDAAEVYRALDAQPPANVMEAIHDLRSLMEPVEGNPDALLLRADNSGRFGVAMMRLFELAGVS